MKKKGKETQLKMIPVSDVYEYLYLLSNICSDYMNKRLESSF